MFKSFFPPPSGKIALNPSILSADFSCLKRSLKNALKADWLHVDIMDGHFVDNLSFGPHILRCVKKITSKPVDVHLMVENPVKFVVPFAKAGADLITVHVESKEPSKSIKLIKELNVKAGITLRPQTHAKKIFPFLEIVNLVLVMSVNPGFGGQEFIASSLEKIRLVRKEINRLGKKIWIQVDGGITPKNVAKLVDAGANCLVMGNSFFNSRKQKEIIAMFRNLRAHFI